MRGILAGYGVTVLVAFIAGCVYATTLGNSRGVNLPPVGSLPVGTVLGIGMVVALATAVAAGVAAFALALPMFAFLLGRNVSSVLAYVGAGALLAVLAGVFCALAHYWADFLSGYDFLFGLLAIAVSGPIAGLMFWIVAVRREAAP